MELDWRNRCVGGERLEDLCQVVSVLGADDDETLYEMLWDDTCTAMPFHRALMRLAAELLWQRAARLAPWQVSFPDPYETLAEDAYAELLRRSGIEFARSTSTSPPPG